MASVDRDTLLAQISPQDLNKIVPFLGDDEAPMSWPEYHEFNRQDGTRHAKLKLSPNDRYYLVFRGIKFTGIVRGSHLYTVYGATGIPHAGGQAMNTRPEAEFAWLTTYYAGRCGRVVKAVVMPDLPVYA
jgi:hypothetical protein